MAATKKEYFMWEDTRMMGERIEFWIPAGCSAVLPVFGSHSFYSTREGGGGGWVARIPPCWVQDKQE